MAIKNYTSDKPLEKIFAELQQTLGTHGAKQISYDYGDDGKVHGLACDFPNEVAGMWTLYVALVSAHPGGAWEALGGQLCRK